MAVWMTATLSSKAQITLPKRVRELLGLRGKGDQVGFVVDEKTHRIIMTKITLVPEEEPYTAEELRKLLKLAKAPGGKAFPSAEAFLKHVRSL
ncbi:MAG: AbrB/MazE/SpoVT family DNA-binding domain-containing protein [Candidatus Omnitrophica bacterium]|nr:AbrB/MazE/SpoVT family DNA-binding domain-containing protein [Candidatus Omnitrophota bacterium]